MLFDIDLQHQIAERQSQGVEPFAPHIDDPIALIGRSNLEDTGRYAAGESQLRRFVGHADIHHLDFDTTQRSPQASGGIWICLDRNELRSRKQMAVPGENGAVESYVGADVDE